MLHVTYYVYLGGGAVPGAVASLTPATTPLYNASSLAIFNDSSPLVLSVTLGPNAHVDFTVRTPKHCSS